jgi:hypothetical protein
MTPTERFETVVAAHQGDPGVARAKMFGAPCLKIGGKIFVTLFKETLVVKLPPARVAALVAAGTATPFDPGMGRVMKEWVALAPDAADWLPLAEEARVYVGALA